MRTRSLPCSMSVVAPPNRQRTRLNLVPGVLLFWPIVFSSWGCATIDADPVGIPIGSYARVCPDSPPVFQVNVRKTAGFGDFDLVNVFVEVNGQEFRCSPPSGGRWGIYRYASEVPNDGDLRFRYRVH